MRKTTTNFIIRSTDNTTYLKKYYNDIIQRFIADLRKAYKENSTSNLTHNEKKLKEPLDKPVQKIFSYGNIHDFISLYLAANNISLEYLKLLSKNTTPPRISTSALSITIHQIITAKHNFQLTDKYYRLLKLKSEDGNGFKKSLKEKDQTIQQLQKSAQENQQSIKQIKESTQEKDRTIRQLKEDSEQTQQALKLAQETAQAKDHTIQQLQKTTQENQQATKQIKENAQTKDHTIRQLKETSEQTQQELKLAHETAQAKDHTIQQLQKTTQENQQAIKQIKENAPEKDHTIRQLKEDSEQTQQALKLAQETAQAKDHTIQQLQKTTQENQQATKQIKENAQTKDNTIRQLKETSEQTQQELKLAQETVQAKDHTIQQLQETSQENQQAIKQIKEIKNTPQGKNQEEHTNNSEQTSSNLIENSTNQQALFSNKEMKYLKNIEKVVKNGRWECAKSAIDTLKNSENGEKEPLRDLLKSLLTENNTKPDNDDAVKKWLDIFKDSQGFGDLKNLLEKHKELPSLTINQTHRSNYYQTLALYFAPKNNIAPDSSLSKYFNRCRTPKKRPTNKTARTKRRTIMTNKIK